MAKKDRFDEFLDKNFNSGSRVRIAKPIGGERDTSYEERRQAEEKRQQDETFEVQENREQEVKEKEGEGSVEISDPMVPLAGSPEVAEQPVEEEPSRKPGRPKSVRGPVVNVNFLLEVEAKQKLERLKMELYRSSVTDLFKEAIHDLFVKYHFE